MCRVNTGAPQCANKWLWLAVWRKRATIWTHMDEQERVDTVHAEGG